MNASEYFRRQRDPKLIDDGLKRTERITCAVSSELKEFLNNFALYQNISISELMFKYIIEGLRRDTSLILFPHPHLNSDICDHIRQNK